MMYVAARFRSLNPAADFRTATLIGATAPIILEVISKGIKFRIAVAILGVFARCETLNLSEGGLPF